MACCFRHFWLQGMPSTPASTAGVRQRHATVPCHSVHLHGPAACRAAAPAACQRQCAAAAALRSSAGCPAAAVTCLDQSAPAAAAGSCAGNRLRKQQQRHQQQAGKAAAATAAASTAPHWSAGGWGVTSSMAVAMHRVTGLTLHCPLLLTWCQQQSEHPVLGAQPAHEATTPLQLWGTKPPQAPPCVTPA